MSRVRRLAGVGQGERNCRPGFGRFGDRRYGTTMTTLQWILGLSAGLFAIAWSAFFVFANNFRRSFGAMPNPHWIGVLPVVVALLVVLSALLPDSGVVLLAAAIAVIGVSVSAARLLREAPLLAVAWYAYAVTWLSYAALALRVE